MYRETNWSLRPGTADDVEVIAELRAVVMRDDLVRLGRYDEHRVRQRLRDGFSPEHTSVVEVDGGFAGCVTMRPYEGVEGGEGLYLEHFYLDPGVQGRGLGTAVLRELLARADEAAVPVRLVVLRGSAARRLYEREGFTYVSEDPVDVLLVREVPAVAAPLTGRLRPAGGR
ncbi:GNAT family N-acetyltransferase [Streptomyces sp. NBC_00250]|uniref:GNAT family N-acetyltransferase n=1 Tax=Streptomyces sp. NBC_00250 TaxID=2903641 RepID=UPI002E2B93FC|nr:GNAT family N-acetyltransferase [Streptomyces sp. NBC_00250]